jgi:hypothetical protein
LGGIFYAPQPKIDFYKNGGPFRILEFIIFRKDEACVSGVSETKTQIVPFALIFCCLAFASHETATDSFYMRDSLIKTSNFKKGLLTNFGAPKIAEIGSIVPPPPYIQDRYK